MQLFALRHRVVHCDTGLCHDTEIDHWSIRASPTQAPALVKATRLVCSDPKGVSFFFVQLRHFWFWWVKKMFRTKEHILTFEKKSLCSEGTGGKWPFSERQCPSLALEQHERRPPFDFFAAVWPPIARNQMCTHRGPHDLVWPGEAAGSHFPAQQAEGGRWKSSTHKCPQCLVRTKPVFHRP